MINSIALLGSSSGRNAGDAALISGVMEAVDSALGRAIPYYIPSIRPDFVRTSYPNIVKPVSMLPWSGSLGMFGWPTYSAIMRSDLTLVFDAPLFDRSLYNPLFNYMSSFALFLPKAKRRGRLIGCYNVGVGPVKTEPGRKMLRGLLEEMDFVAVRDQGSYDLVRSIGVENPRVFITADAALNVTPASRERVDQLWQRAGLSLGEEVLGINVSKYLDTWADSGRNSSMGRERFLSEFAEGLKLVNEAIRVPFLFVGTQHHDVDVTEDLMGRLPEVERKHLITNRECSHYDIQGVLGRLQLLFGMRLHATILASSQLTPIAALPHQPKVAHYFDSIGVADRIINFDNFSGQKLADHILKAWQDRVRIRTILEQNIPQSKARARQAAMLIAKIDRGQSLDSAFNELAVDAGSKLDSAVHS